jgi:ABC-type Fe3+-siderophore transport system permease subunit
MMAQYCPRCKWYSADGLTHCSTCGAPLDADWDEEDEEDEAVEEHPLLERLGWPLALAAAVLVGGLALYGRLATAEILGAASAAVERAIAAVKGALGAAYAWLIGPTGEYKDFVVIALVGSAFVWLVLYVLARLGRR